MANYIYGVNPVKHAIEAKKIKNIYLLKDHRSDLLNVLKSNNISYKFVDSEFIKKTVGDVIHQGVIAEVSDYTYLSLDALLKKASSKQKSLVIMLDGIEDPHNFGAIIRIADAFNADGIIIRNTRQVPLNGTVVKVSTGAINFVDCVEVNNLSNAIKELKDHGFWIYASDGEGVESCDAVAFADKSCIIIGSEGFGISSLVKKNSDVIIKIPMAGHVNSLNASSAASVLIYKIYEYQNLKRK